MSGTSEIDSFAQSLFSYLCCELEFRPYYDITSKHFNEIMAMAVFRIQEAASDFNMSVLNRLGHGVDRKELCQAVCDKYPGDDYFKRLYYMTAFILDMMVWMYTASIPVSFDYVYNIWLIIFQNNFASEFESYGGFRGLANAGFIFSSLKKDEILIGGLFSDAFSCGIEGLVEKLAEKGKTDSSERSGDSYSEAMEIEDTSLDETAQGSKAKEEIEEKQPGGIDDPCEGTSKESSEGASSSHVSRKRRWPSQTDPDTDSLLPSQPKMDRN